LNQTDNKRRSLWNCGIFGTSLQVVQWKGYREASLEDELGVKLFSRAKRMAQLTPEGEAFYDEAVRTLAQAEAAVNTARRAGEG
jgi:hypothetical protein